jgi:hypothetical protein
MIRKPEGQEQESKAHRAVGRVMDVGGTVRDASVKGARIAGGCYLAGFLIIMMFGLLVSATPLWFKAIGLVLLAVAFRFVRLR